MWAKFKNELLLVLDVKLVFHMYANSENVPKKSNKDEYLWKKVYMLERKSIQLPLQKKSVMPLNKNIGRKKNKTKCTFSDKRLQRN